MPAIVRDSAGQITHAVGWSPSGTATDQPPEIGHLTQFVGSMRKWVGAGLPLHSHETIAAWKSICLSCDQWDPAGWLGMGKCRLCGCSGLKRHLRTEICTRLKLPVRPGRRPIKHAPPYRILFASPCWFRGGLETVTINHLRRLKSDRWEPSLLVGITEEMMDSVPVGVQTQVDRDCFEWDFPPSLTTQVKEHAKKVLEELAPDILVGQLSHALFLAAQEVGIPVTIEYMHSGVGWDALNRPSDLAIAVSKWSAQAARNNRQIACPLHVVHNGVDSSLFYPDVSARELTRKKLGFSPRDKVILYLARISAEKDPMLWVDIVAKLHRSDPQIKGLVVGSFRANHDLWNAMVDHGRKNGLEVGRDLVHVSAPYDQVRHYICASNLMLHTSKSETFGMALVESLFCGIPVVAFGCGGIAELNALVGYPGALSIARPKDTARLLALVQARLSVLPTLFPAEVVKRIQSLSADASTAKFTSLLEIAIAQV